MAKILIFEDNFAFAAEMVQSALDLGHTAYETSSIEGLRAILETVEIEAAVVDLMISTDARFRAIGSAVTKLLKADREEQEIVLPILFVSGAGVFKGTDKDKILWTTLGADSFLRKPVQAIEVITRLTTLLNAQD